MKKVMIAVLGICLPAILQAQNTVDKIEILGNDRVTRETILYYLSAREGEYCDEEMLKRDFRILWSTGFFADIRIEEAESARGKIIRIIVEENPVIKNIVFKTGKKVKENDIVNKLKEKDEFILPYSYYNPAKIQRIKGTIGDLLVEKGLQAANIDAVVNKKGRNEVELVFKIDEGTKIRVGRIAFEGSAKIPDGYLREAMKDNKVHGLLSWIGGKDVFKPNKLPEDLALIKKKLQENGFMEATIGEPRTEMIERRTIFFRKKKMMKIIIPVNAGYLYKVGDVKIEGNKAISGKYLKSLVKQETGDVYSTKTREKSVEDMGEAYRNIGYLYSQIVPVENLDPKRKIVNVTYTVYEGEIAYLHRLEFRGNDYTKDKVIRREMMMREGDRFSLALFKDSILRIKQLGLVDLEKEPDIKPDPEDPTQIDVTVNVKELQRNNIQFTAGYSGYQGAFVAFSYSTVNFLGAGENLEFMIQTGKRIKNYSFGFTEPYVFDKPMTLGFNVFDRLDDIPSFYKQKRRGINLTYGLRLFGYWRANFTYSYQNIKTDPPSETYADAAGNPIYYYSQNVFGNGNINMSSIEPLLYRSTIDSPIAPTSGTMYSLSFKLAGTFLGGEIDLIRPRLEFAHFRHALGKHVIGAHVEFQYMHAIKKTLIPWWEKFYLGGERSIRGYEIYTIGPRDASNLVVGGDKSLVVNLEYIIPIGEPLQAIFFYDFGNSLLASQKFNLKDMYTSGGLEARIFVPALRVPFRLIFAYNNRKVYHDESNFAFRFAVGTTF